MPSVRILLLLIVVATVVGFAGCAKNEPAPEPVIQELQEYILAHQQSPEDYILELFNEYEVVCLGEWHRINHDQQLIRSLIPKLYEKRIFILAMEFARSQDQPMIDQLLAGDTFDESLARRLLFNWNPRWAFQDYLEIYRTAWELNATLTDRDPKFRILGINCTTDWSYIKTKADLEVDSLRRKVWRGCGEIEWASYVFHEVEKGDQMLVYCGLHHAFTEYLQPIVDDEGKFIRFEEDRMGRYLFDAMGKSVATVCLHGPWYAAGGYDDAKVRPVDGVIDEVMASLGDKFQPVGFDVKNSPFGNLAPTGSVYSAGYDGFTLGDFCDGWIYQKPFSEYETSKFIDEFFTEENLPQAREQASNPWFRNATLEDFIRVGRDGLEKQQKMLNDL